MASATLNASQQVGGSLGTALLNTIFATSVAGYLAVHGHSVEAAAQSAVHGYTVGFVFSSAALGLAALVSFFLIRAPRAPAVPESVDAAVTESAVEPVLAGVVA